MPLTSSTRSAVAEASIDHTDLAELVEWLNQKPELMNGRLVKELEASWSAWLGRRHSVMVNSAASANLLMYSALLASGHARSNQVVVPAVSSVATIAPAMQLGFEPIMCEADWQTFGLDLTHLESLCETNPPAAVIVAHNLGVPGDMDRLLTLKARYGFMLLEDARGANGATYRGARLGTFGDLASMSLSDIGGAIVSTDDAALYNVLLQLRAQELTSPHAGLGVQATDLQARLGLSQMSRTFWVCARRVANQRRYEDVLAHAPQVHVPHNSDGVSCGAAFVALASSPDHRLRITQALHARHVEIEPMGMASIGHQPFWTARYGVRAFPVADAIGARGFTLPNNPEISSREIDEIAKLVMSVAACDRAAA
jgi:CDP-4-dehydro-6-deoxyglucose reductase, E1